MTSDHLRRTYVYVDLDREGQVPAGLLTSYEIGAGRENFATFRYGDRYLARPNAIALDPVRLPLPAVGETTTFRTEVGSDIFGGLRDAAPDRWGRAVLDHAARRPLSEFEYLVGSGTGRVGALAFGPDLGGPRKVLPPNVLGDDPEVLATDVLDLDTLQAMADDLRAVDPASAAFRACLDAATGLGGGRPKASVMLDGKPWLAKFPMRGDLFDAIRCEYATMNLARDCGHDVPETRLLEIDGRTVYLIRRFDMDTGDEGVLRRRPFISAYTIVGAENDLSAHHYAYEDIVNGARMHGVAARDDARRLFARAVFNILCGNDDDHLRNHGFLHDGRGWVLSPLYDVLPRPQVATSRRLSLALGEYGRDATIENALSGCHRFGLGLEEAAAIVAEQRGIVFRRWRQCFEEAGFEAAAISAFVNCFLQTASAAANADPIPGFRRGT